LRRASLQALPTPVHRAIHRGGSPGRPLGEVGSLSLISSAAHGGAPNPAARR
jgi:hypothetical protein